MAETFSTVGCVFLFVASTARTQLITTEDVVGLNPSPPSGGIRSRLDERVGLPMDAKDNEKKSQHRPPATA